MEGGLAGAVLAGATGGLLGGGLDALAADAGLRGTAAGDWASDILGGNTGLAGGMRGIAWQFMEEKGCMVSFLMMLALAPVEWGITWIYALLPRHLDRYFWTKYLWIKFIVWVAFVVLITGVFGAQLNFLAHREPSFHTRQFYLLALLIIEGIPMLAIMIYRYYQDPSSFYWFDGIDQTKRSERARR